MIKFLLFFFFKSILSQNFQSTFFMKKKQKCLICKDRVDYFYISEINLLRFAWISLVTVFDCDKLSANNHEMGFSVLDDELFCLRTMN